MVMDGWLCLTLGEQLLFTAIGQGAVIFRSRPTEILPPPLKVSGHYIFALKI